MEGSMGSPVEEFYKGKTVFITGATGFMGKVVLCRIWLKLETFSSFFVKTNSGQGAGGETAEEHLCGAHLLADQAEGNISSKQNQAKGKICSQNISKAEGVISASHYPASKIYDLTDNPVSWVHSQMT